MSSSIYLFVCMCFLFSYFAGLFSCLICSERCVKHEGALYKEVFPGKIEAHLSVTVKVRGPNSKWRAI